LTSFVTDITEQRSKKEYGASFYDTQFNSVIPIYRMVKGQTGAGEVTREVRGKERLRVCTKHLSA
jgi:hypothetical protein